jgi:hypothetical protein
MRHPRKVIAVRFDEEELAQLDELVEAESPPANWWESGASRSSVIRAAIAERYTRLQARNTKRDPQRNTPSSRK